MIHTLPERDYIWDELRPHGRVVFYEGDDPSGFAAEMLALDIDVTAPIPWDPWAFPDETDSLHVPFSGAWGGYLRDPFGRHFAFYIPVGRVEEIYAPDRWPLGS